MSTLAALAANPFPTIGIRRGTWWLSWFIAIALLALIVGAAIRFSGWSSFVDVAQRAQPAWLVAAVALQLATYVAQGGVWRGISRASGSPLTRRAAFELSVAKVFADQAIPSAGLSGNVLVARDLRRHGHAAPAVGATVLINVASYFFGYALAVVAALAIVARSGLNVTVAATAGIFMVASMAVSITIVRMAGTPEPAQRGRLASLPGVRNVLEFIATADGQLVRSYQRLAAATALQLVVILLDAATLWALIVAFGVVASATGVFAAFMVASLLRTVGVLPGGLAAFEGTAVVALHAVGVDLAVALSATLVFRVLSFWLPMVPGCWYTRRAMTQSPR